MSCQGSANSNIFEIYPDNLTLFTKTAMKNTKAISAGEDAGMRICLLRQRQTGV